MRVHYFLQFYLINRIPHINNIIFKSLYIQFIVFI